MRLLLIAIALFPALAGKAQTKLDKTIATAVCQCIDKFKDMNEERFIECFSEAMSKNEQLLMDEIKRLGLDDTEEAGYEFGQKIFKSMSVSLVYSCKNYAKFMDDVRMYNYRNMNKDSIKTEMQNMAKIETAQQDQSFFINRGINYFLLGEFVSALNDFNKILNDDPKAYQAKYMKAWVLEKQKQYDEAIAIYNELAGLMGQNEFKIFAAICEQKKKGIL